MKHFFSLRILVWVWALSVGTAWPAFAESSAEPIVVPTEVCGDYFFIPITLAPGKGYSEDRTLWFLYDTGASISTVDSKSIERVSGKKIKLGQWASIKNATAGPVKINKMRARVHNLSHLSLAMGREIDGILAFTTFKDFLLTLDYKNHEIRLKSGELPRPDDDTVFSTKGPDSRPWLTVEFSNRKRRMLLDSGAARSGLVVRDIDRFETTKPAVPFGASVRLTEIEVRSGARAESDARLGPYIFQTPILESTPGFELIGGDIMRFFDWTFDQKNKRVRLEQHILHEPVIFEPIIAHGMVLVPKASGFKVTTVLNNTPAAAADIQPDDVVTHFNGIPMAEIGCDEDITDRKNLTITLQRNGKGLEVELFLFTLVE